MPGRLNAIVRIFLIAAAVFAGPIPRACSGEEEPINGVLTVRFVVTDRAINLTRSHITNLRVLRGADTVESLTLTGNRLSSLRGVGEMRNLRALHASGNPITDLGDLGELKRLRDLILEYTGKNLDGLDGLDTLERLALVNCALTEISAVGNLPELRELSLIACRVDDPALADSPRKLENLHIVNKSVPLAYGLPWPLRFARTPQAGFSGESGTLPRLDLPNLRQLVLIGDGAVDIGNIRHLPTIQTLELPDNKIADISPLASTPLLETLILDDNPLSGLDGLAGLTRLAHLSLKRTGISDLSPLAGLRNLRELLLDENALTDIGALENLPNLRGVSLDQNRLSLSQLHRVRAIPNLWLGAQDHVDLPALASPIRVGEKRDLRSELTLGGEETTIEMLLVDTMGATERDGPAYTADDGFITFHMPGKYYMIMRNEAVRSKGILPDETYRRRFAVSYRLEETAGTSSDSACPNNCDSGNDFRPPPAPVTTRVFTVVPADPAADVR